MSDRPRMQLTQRSTPGPQVARPATPSAFGGSTASPGVAASTPAGALPSALQTIAFPPPPGASAAPGTAAVAPVDGGVGPAAAAAAAPVPLEDQIDAIYEAVVERLRRDMLIERERMGDLVGDLLR